jgi:hypothetical protein
MVFQSQLTNFHNIFATVVWIINFNILLVCRQTKPYKDDEKLYNIISSNLLSSSTTRRYSRINQAETRHVQSSTIFYYRINQTFTRQVMAINNVLWTTD